LGPAQLQLVASDTDPLKVSASPKQTDDEDTEAIGRAANDELTVIAKVLAVEVPQALMALKV
jgi:hypothetical protein